MVNNVWCKALTLHMAVGFISITIKANLKVVDFIDIELHSTNGTYRQYRKPNGNLMYVNINFNEKHIPKSISKEIAKLSLNEEIFNNNTVTL